MFEEILYYKELQGYFKEKQGRRRGLKGKIKNEDSGNWWRS